MSEATGCSLLKRSNGIYYNRALANRHRLLKPKPTDYPLSMFRLAGCNETDSIPQ